MQLSTALLIGASTLIFVVLFVICSWHVPICRRCCCKKRQNNADASKYGRRSRKNQQYLPSNSINGGGNNNSNNNPLTSSTLSQFDLKTPLILPISTSDSANTLSHPYHHSIAITPEMTSSLQICSSTTCPQQNNTNIQNNPVIQQTNILPTSQPLNSSILSVSTSPHKPILTKTSPPPTESPITTPKNIYKPPVSFFEPSPTEKAKKRVTIQIDPVHEQLRQADPMQRINDHRARLNERLNEHYATSSQFDDTNVSLPTIDDNSVAAFHQLHMDRGEMFGDVASHDSVGSYSSDSGAYTDGDVSDETGDDAESQQNRPIRHNDGFLSSIFDTTSSFLSDGDVDHVEELMEWYVEEEEEDLDKLPPTNPETIENDQMDLIQRITDLERQQHQQQQFFNRSFDLANPSNTLITTTANGNSLNLVTPIQQSSNQQPKSSTPTMEPILPHSSVDELHMSPNNHTVIDNTIYTTTTGSISSYNINPHNTILGSKQTSHKPNHLPQTSSVNSGNSTSGYQYASDDTYSHAFLAGVVSTNGSYNTYHNNSGDRSRETPKKGFTTLQLQPPANNPTKNNPHTTKKKPTSPKAENHYSMYYAGGDEDCYFDDASSKYY